MDDLLVKLLYLVQTLPLTNPKNHCFVSEILCVLSYFVEVMEKSEQLGLIR